MPKIPVSEFPSPPSIGDKVVVKGEVKSIDEATGEVEISYDSVKVNGKSKENDNPDDNSNLPEEMTPNKQTLDEALANAFPNTQ